MFTILRQTNLFICTYICRQMKMTDVRNSSRCIWDSVEEAYKIWERIKEHIPDIFKNRAVQGLNER